jgi:hypothetical protein
VVVVSEDIVEDGFRASVLGLRRFGDDAGPEFILLGETSFNVEVREQVLDVSLAVAAVAGVSRDALAEEFLDSRDEGVVVREFQVRERDVGGTQAASQRRGVV